MSDVFHSSEKLGDFNMSISDAYEIREFVVLTENTHKYSSTKVESGGGIAGQQNVSSTVTHHVSQDIWLRDPETQKETKFTCDNYTLDVRPGHSLVFFKNRNTSSIERIVNINTGDINECNGEYNQARIKNEIREKFQWSFILSPLALIPLVCLLIFCFLLRTLISCLLSRNFVGTLPVVIGFISSAYMCSFWLQLFREDFLAVQFLDGLYKVLFYGPGPHWWLVLLSCIGFFYFFNRDEKSADDIKHCHELDEFVSTYIRDNY